ncbi:hypothetical protein K438DRAFT_796360 [Mycena galopus ATCC 62051]|nr:hypothetical protein K438DRAFT_796360 [Mycena galopus ATCC 62051]
MPQSGSVGPQTKPGTFRIASTTESSDIGQPLNDPKRIGEQWPPGEFSQCVTASVPGNLMQKDEAELLDQRQERKKKLNEARENALDLERSPSPSSPSTRSMWLGEGRKRRRTQEMDGEAAQKMGEARSEYEAERGQEEAQLLFQRTETERRPDELRGPASLTGAKSGAITYHNLLTLISSIPESRINNGTVLNAYHQSMFAEDSLSAVVNSHYWRRTLLKLIADLDIPEDVALRNALREDEERLAKNIVAILYSDSEQKAVLNLKGNSAQNFLDVLQDVEYCASLDFRTILTAPAANRSLTKDYCFKKNTTLRPAE